MTYQCQCPCGTTTFEIKGEPITRFYYHCTIGQQQYEASHADITLYKLDDIELPADNGILYGRYKRFGAVDRGRCPACEKPVLGPMGEAEKGYAFVAARNYVNPESLPPAEMHVFYGTRTEGAEDTLPKYSNALTSRWAFIKRMLKAG